MCNCYWQWSRLCVPDAECVTEWMGFVCCASDEEGIMLLDDFCYLQRYLVNLHAVVPIVYGFLCTKYRNSGVLFHYVCRKGPVILLQTENLELLM
jgi:hypothetical protein